MDTISNISNAASKALFGKSTAQDPNHPNTSPHATETGTLGSGAGHNTTTGQNTNDPSYTHGTTGATGDTTYGASEDHSPYTAKSIDPRVHSNNGTGNTTSTSTNAGPHNSNIANKVDPRVDSDRDGSGITGNTSGTGNYGVGNTTAGPHSSNLANNADPRVDSDRDGSGITGNTTGTGNYGIGNTSSSTTAGPHSSNLANKADPRVDSNLDGPRTATGATHGAGGSAVGGEGLNTSTNDTWRPNNANATSATGTGYSSSTTAGPHNSNLANKVDPRVDSDRDGSRTAGTTTHTSGTGHSTATTAGPHDSNLANKVDPRVDSDQSNITGHTSTNPSHIGATGTTTGTGSESRPFSEFTGNHPPNNDSAGIKFAEPFNQPQSGTGVRQGIRDPGEAPARGLQPLDEGHGPMTGSHSHRGSGQLRATQDTYDTLHRRDHADGADHTKGQEPQMDGKGTPGGMPEMIKKGLEELKGSR